MTTKPNTKLSNTENNIFINNNFNNSVPVVLHRPPPLQLQLTSFSTTNSSLQSTNSPSTSFRPLFSPTSLSSSSNITPPPIQHSRSTSSLLDPTIQATTHQPPALPTVYTFPIFVVVLLIVLVLFLLLFFLL